jgi:hypothetical protein
MLGISSGVQEPNVTDNVYDKNKMEKNVNAYQYSFLAQHWMECKQRDA